jgi:hypothetical protein
MTEDAAWVLSIIYGKVIEILGNKASVNQKSKMSSIRTSTHERKIVFRLFHLSLDSFTLGGREFLGVANSNNSPCTLECHCELH